MLKLLRAWRERGWVEIDCDAYTQAWQRFGGSFATHPQVVERLSTFVQIELRYLGWVVNGEVVAAVPCWGSHVALSKQVLKREGKRGLLDMGNAEIILPVAAQAVVPLRQRVSYVSELNAGRISTLRAQPQGLAMARAPEDYSKNSATTSAVNSVCWRRRAGCLFQCPIFRRRSKQPLTAICFSVAGDLKCPARLVWLKYLPCCASS